MTAFLCFYYFATPYFNRRGDLSNRPPVGCLCGASRTWSRLSSASASSAPKGIPLGLTTSAGWRIAVWFARKLTKHRSGVQILARAKLFARFAAPHFVRRPNYVFLELSSLYSAFTNPELQSYDMPLVHTNNESPPNLPPPVRRRGSYNSIAV